MEDKIEGLGKGQVIIQQDFDNLETELQEARTQITRLQRKQMGNNNKIALARFKISNLEQIIKDIQVRHQADKKKFQDAIYELKNRKLMPPKKTSTSEAPTMTQAAIKKLVADSVFAALETQAANMVRKALLVSSTGFKELNQYSPVATVPKPARFQELATLCSTMVPDSKKIIEVFIGGLPRNIERNVTASKPQTLEEAINISQRIMDQNRRQEAVRAYVATLAKNSRYAGNLPLCRRCVLHHT
ncbi:hypothetical protein Tco_0544963 [Tanacetum coccineum]